MMIETPEIAVVPAQKPSVVFPAIVFFLFIATTAATGALWTEVQYADKTLLHMQKKFTAVETQQTIMNNTLQQQATQFSHIQNQVNQLVSNASRDQQSFKLAEITYLVRIANLRLSTQHDISSTLDLLKQASQEVTTLNNPTLEPFQQALLKNITALQAMIPLDMENLMDQLDQLQQRVPALSILVAPKPNTSILENTKHLADKKWWNRAWDNIKASLRELIIVRHQREDIPAMMSPSQQLYLEENLQLLLIQAQWGLMNHNTGVYLDSLNKADTWVQKYYVQDSASTQAFLKTLNQLKKINIAPTLPSLLQTLSLINAGAHA